MFSFDSILKVFNPIKNLNANYKLITLLSSLNDDLTLYWPSAVRLSSSTEGTVATRYESDLPVYTICNLSISCVQYFLCACVFFLKG